MKKKLFAVLMTMSMITSLAACGQTEKPTTSETPPASNSRQEDQPLSESSDEALSLSDEKITLRFSWWGGDARHEATD